MAFPADALQAVRHSLVPLTSSAAEYPAIAERLAQARLVLLGEGTHGTHEFYRARALITRSLIESHGFAGVVVEADWPDAYRVNRWVRGMANERNASEALSGFLRFPTWMWRNREVAEFVAWLHKWNQAKPPDRRAGFYGLDLYSLHASIRVVLDYLDKFDPDGARRARARYSCFDHFGSDPQTYGYATSFGLSDSCEREVVAQLVELRRRAAEYVSRDGRVAEDDYFFSAQNARVVQNAERYYRAMFGGRQDSWNLRDRHMVETLEAVMAYLIPRRGGTKLVVWAHNSHLGDARATETGQRGELNVGQLVRERYGSEAVLVGFTTHTGSVTAASDWREPTERKRVRPSLPDSYERLFHDAGRGNFILWFNDTELAAALDGPLLERAIGVIYLPKSERTSHYFKADMARQFDAVMHFDETRAVEPLEWWAHDETDEPAETYPYGV